MRLGAQLTFLAFWSQQVAAVTYIQKSQYCVSACSTALQHVSFGGQMPAMMAPAVPCTSQLYIDSLFYCAATYCTEKQVDSGLSYSNETCKSEAGQALPSYTAFKANQYPMSIARVQRISQKEAKTKTDEPVLPDRGLFDLGYASTSATNKSDYFNWTFTWALYGYWGLVIVVGMVNRIVQFGRHRRSPQPDLIRGKVIERQSGSTIARAHRAVRRSLLMPLAFGNRDGKTPKWAAIPSRTEALLVATYVVMNIVFMFPGYDLVEGNLNSPEKRMQLGHYVCNRAGTLALANIPIIWVFAARNDPLLWLTGWSYATYSQFHRWSARIATLLAIVHASGYSILDTWQGRYLTAWTVEFWYCGAIAVVSMSVLVGSSIYMVRKRWYDVFLVLHISFAVVLLVALWFHLKIHNGAYNGYIWPAVAIWALDRLLRISRVAYFSLIPSIKGVQATAEWDESKDLVRLDVTDFFKNTKTTPGGFYYVYEPGRIRGYESHPFTLCSWNYPNPTSTKGSETSSMEEKREDYDANLRAEFKDVELGVDKVITNETIPDTRGSNDARHTFLIRPKDGFTQRLRHKHSKQFHVLLEGPYGLELYMHQYAAVVMIVGGSGITAAVSRTYSLLRKTAPPYVRLVWVAQKQATVDDVCANELSGVLGNSRFKMDVFLTSDETKGVPLNDVPYGLHSGRPNVDVILDEERDKCAGSMAVFCCGPPGLDASVRNSVVRLLREDGPHVAFLEERFSW
ncbi:uncharacterized protein RCC_12099 [Ramularia collo-cygni]|uniref:FAD-binding FR-type domain-containing protein n=1 Tax=Ramularia collo-cygni TaxID=112498 RepID=A0A2D3UTD7_9PEZI|nr:uncharacterized protein RCC_12099 [Ramularia collo-cygni]CZT15077.1 uncharacterized protein RCC_12099 [Ramularia collo-cygni]